MRYSALIFVCLAWSAQLVVAKRLYLGCYQGGGGRLYRRDLGGDACGDFCLANDYIYSIQSTYDIWNEDHSEQGVACGCDDSLGYTPDDWVYTENCLQFYTPNIEINLLQTTFDRLGCGSVSDYENREFTNVADFEACFQQCKDYTYAFTDRLDPNVDLRCNCSNNPDDFYVDNNCENHNLADFTWMIFQHPAGSSGSPSSWVKRQAKERLQREIGQKPIAICPKGMSACRTSSNDDYGFECIDVQTELESCGGCIHGDFNSDLGKPLSKRGTNCVTLPGISHDGVTCINGECLAFAWEEGSKLRGDKCEAAA
ncbi:uncharacterized protein L201_000160 [Kwoniella dendrophila CBS 6074]|uniref:Protein CPL1-like domain-containing protein n=1 Tax=Kwoniella dendrophila CBS 6074 TaxID=1295534 RepID=A0AAX4JK92_9TREE